jgi:hypothetical protein
MDSAQQIGSRHIVAALESELRSQHSSFTQLCK